MAHLNNDAIKKAYGNVVKDFASKGATLEYVTKVCIPPVVKKPIFKKPAPASK